MRKNTIKIVGCGPGNPDYITPVAWKFINDADILVGAKRLLELVELKDKEIIEVDKHISKVLDTMEEKFAEQVKMAVMVTGDPGIASFARAIVKRFGRKRCEIVPGISSIQAAFAGVGIDWIDAEIINVHGREWKLDQSQIEKSGKAALLTGKSVDKKELFKLINKLSSDYAIFICENLTYENERIYEIAESKDIKDDFEERTIVLFIRKELL